MRDRDVDHAQTLHGRGLYTIRLSERQMCYGWLHVTPGLFARVRACFKGARPTRSMFCTTGRRGRKDFQARILFEKPRLILIFCC